MVTLWDAARGGRIIAALESAGNSYGLAFSPDGRILATAGSDSVDLWDVVRRVKIIALQQRGVGAACLAFSPDGSPLAVGNGDHKIRLWKIKHRSKAM